MFQLINDKGNLITHLDDWPRPKKEGQWQCGRSAMELARYWTDTHLCGSVPPDYRELLEPKFPGIKLHEGRPEYATALPPKGSSGPRMHDLHLWGTGPTGSMTVCVEAKADESFGQTLEEERRKAQKDLLSNPRSEKKTRLEDLLECVWGVRQLTELLSDLRYQLLHALAGTAIQTLKDMEKAEESACGTGVLLIHVFETDKTQWRKLEENRRDLDKFARALPDVTILVTGILPGCLYGPTKVSVPADSTPSGCPTLIDVYLGIL